MEDDGHRVADRGLPCRHRQRRQRRTSPARLRPEGARTCNAAGDRRDGRALAPVRARGRAGGPARALRLVAGAAGAPGLRVAGQLQDPAPRACARDAGRHGRLDAAGDQRATCARPRGAQPGRPAGADGARHADVGSPLVQHRTGRFPGVGDVDIFWQAWLPDGDVRAVIGMAHGASEHSGRYAWTGEQLAARGYALSALDHRGHGQSSGARAVIDRMSYAVEDLGTLLTKAAHESSHGVKPFLFGHSMGGCIALAFATRREEEIHGLMLSAPVAVLAAASPVQRIAAHVISIVAPKTGVFEIDSSTVSRDPEVVRDYDSDPLNYRGKVPARTIHELSQEIARFPDALPNITVPLLVQVGTGDQLVPPRAADLVYERAASEDKTIEHYDGLFHEILNEPEREQVVGDLLDWLDKHA